MLSVVMKKGTKELCKRVGVSISQRRGRWRVKLGKSITGSAVVDKLVESETEAVGIVEYWLADRINRTQAARDLSDSDLEDAKRAFDHMRKYGVEETMLFDLAKAHCEQLPNYESVTVEEATKLFREDRIERNKKDSYIQSLKTYFKKLIKDYGHVPMHELTKRDLQSYLRKYYGKLTNKTYNNNLGMIRALWNFAEEEEYIVRNVSEKLRPKDVDDPPVGILKVDEVKALIDLAMKEKPMMVIPLALQAFAGLRRSEVFALEWEKVKSDYITIDASVAKNRSLRVVPILPPLEALLKNRREEEGRVIDLSYYDFNEYRKFLCKKAEIKNWPHNCLRHGFVSYRMASLQNDVQTALEAGHTTDISHSHYKALLDNPEKESKEYWNLFSEISQAS